MGLNLEAPTEDKLMVSLRFHSARWHNKDKSIKKRDLGNLEKLILDAIFKTLGVDDSHIFLLSLEKVVDVEDYTEVTILPWANQTEGPLKRGGLYASETIQNPCCY